MLIRFSGPEVVISAYLVLWYSYKTVKINYPFIFFGPKAGHTRLNRYPSGFPREICRTERIVIH